MEKTILPFAAWEPDRPDLGGDYVMRARNVIPAKDGYRPFPSILPEGYILPAKAQGAESFKTLNGGPFTIAGTNAALYARFLGDWQLKSPEMQGSVNPWSLALYGSTLIATNGVDDPFYATVGIDTLTDFETLSGAPGALYAEVVGNFVMMGNLRAQANAVQWCAIDNPLDWPIPGTDDAQYKQSDIQIFPDGGAVQAIASGMSAYEGLIFLENAIYRAQYVGSPYVFQFTEVDKNRGTIAPRSVIQAGNMVYFLCNDGFFATDGHSVRNIGFERVNLWWADNSDNTRRYETLAVYDPSAGVVGWAFASASCPADRFDRILIYHPELGTFSLVAQDTTWLYSDASRGVTLEELDAYGPLDDLPFSLDSRALMGGAAVMACFDMENHACLFAGTPLEAVLETTERGGNRIFVHGVRALIDGAVPVASIHYRDFQSCGGASKPCSTPSKLNGIAYTRLSTRYARVRVNIPSVEWTHAQGVELYFENEGSL